MKNLTKALWRSDGKALFGRAMSAGFWAVSLRGIVRLLLIVRTVILARLLLPEDFGLMAIATISILFLERVTQSSFDSALVQQSDDIRPYLSSAWTLQIVRGLLIAAILGGSAPLIAQFFDAPEAANVIRVLSITLVISGFDNIATVAFIKDLRFDKYFVLQMAKYGTDVVVSIAAAYALRSVWALVIGALAGSLGRLIVSHLIVAYRPRIRWVWSQIKLLFNFGKWITAGQLLNFATSEIDDLLVGRIDGLTALGWYRMAYHFSQAVATEITSVTSQVAFPTYSQLQNQRARLREAYLGTLHFVAFLGFPLAVGTFLIADDLVIGLLGDQWLPVITPLRLLSLAGLIRGLSATIGPLMQSQGRPDVPPRFSLVKLAMLAVLLVPAITEFGIDGAAASVTIAGAMSGVPALLYALRNVSASASQTWQAIGMPWMNTLLMATAVVATDAALFPEPSAVSFLSLSAIGVGAYALAVAGTTAIGIYRMPRDLVAQIKKSVG